MTRKILLGTLVLLSLSGFMLHYKIHPFLTPDGLTPGGYTFSGTYFLASLFPMIDLVVVTLLFMWRKTAIYGYLFNGLIVIYGTVFMAHYSIAVLMANPLPPSQWIMHSLLPDIGIAWADFFVGKALFETYLSGK